MAAAALANIIYARWRYRAASVRVNTTPECVPLAWMLGMLHAALHISYPGPRDVARCVRGVACMFKVRKFIKRNEQRIRVHVWDGVEKRRGRVMKMNMHALDVEYEFPKSREHTRVSKQASMQTGGW